MTDRRNLEKLDRDWRRQVENAQTEEIKGALDEDMTHDKLTEILKEHAHIDGEQKG